MKDRPIQECIKATGFPRGAVVATVSGGDPDGRRFYNFDDPATSLLPGIRQEARCLDPSEFRDKDLELYPILEAEVGSPPSVVAAAGHTLSPHAAVFAAASAHVPKGGNRATKKSSKKKR